MIASTMANPNAGRDPSTWNPGTMALTSNTINALITRENKPSVRTVIGSATMLIIGLINALITPNTIPAISESPYPVTSTPGRMDAVTKTANPLTRIFTSSCIE